MHEFKSSFFWLLPQSLRRRRWARIVARETSARGAKSGALAVPRSDSSR
jgi:hypothetical protein